MKMTKLMNIEEIILTTDKKFEPSDVISLYKLNKWSSAEKPEQLIQALRNSHTLILAYTKNQLVGLAYAISDGHLVVYYPHMLVHPEFHGCGIGGLIMRKFWEKYGNFHMQMLTADGKAIDFYKKQGFERAGETEPMWIYGGKEH